MKLACTVIEDMLPIYMDGICSDETEVLVQEHLSQCPKCQNMLAAMRTNVAFPKVEADDLKPLQAIQKRWERSRKAAARKGMCVMLAVVLAVLTVLAGVWYFGYGKYYYEIAEHMDPVLETDLDMGSADFMKQAGDFRVGIWIPPLLSDSGFIRVTDKNGMVMFLYPQFGGGYEFRVSVYESSNRYYMVWLNEDLTPNFSDHPIPVRSQQEQARIRQLLMEQRQQILNICECIYTTFGIQLLDRQVRG